MQVSVAELRGILTANPRWRHLLLQRVRLINDDRGIRSFDIQMPG